MMTPYAPASYLYTFNPGTPHRMRRPSTDQDYSSGVYYGGAYSYPEDEEDPYVGGVYEPTSLPQRIAEFEPLDEEDEYDPGLEGGFNPGDGNFYPDDSNFYPGDAITDDLGGILGQATSNFTNSLTSGVGQYVNSKLGGVLPGMNSGTSTPSTVGTATPSTNSLGGYGQLLKGALGGQSIQNTLMSGVAQNVLGSILH